MKRSLYTYQNETKSLIEWSKDIRCQVSYTTLVKRITKYKWVFEKSLLTKKVIPELYKNTIKIGSKFARLTIVGINNKYKCLCVCDCGKGVLVNAYQLISGHTKSCGCLRKEKQKEAGKKNTIGIGKAAANKVFLEYKTSAKKRNINWELTREEFDEITQNKCYYCGEPPSQVRKCIGFNGMHTYNGIDRVDSNKSYKKENCVPCCKKCNYAKLNMSQQEFYNHIKKIYNYLKLC